MHSCPCKPVRLLCCVLMILPWHDSSCHLPFCALATDVHACALAYSSLTELLCKPTVSLQEPNLTAKVGCAELRAKMEALKSSSQHDERYLEVALAALQRRLVKALMAEHLQKKQSREADRAKIRPAAANMEAPEEVGGL